MEGVIRIAAAGDVHASEAIRERVEASFARVEGEADVILHVRDIASPESDAQAADVREVLDRLGVEMDEGLMAKVAADRGVSRAQVALAWLARNPAVDAPIVGATKPEHLADAVASVDVVLNDVSGDRLKSALATINGNLTRQVAKKSISEDERKKALDRIVPAETIDALADCDLVIETAVEKEETKRKIFNEVCAVLKPDAIVASNSSSISITRLAASTDRP